MDLRIVCLYRQYFQQLDKLSYPSAAVLLEPSIQNEISYKFFDSSNGEHLPPLSYQRRALKDITDRILSAIMDPDEDVCFSLWPAFVLTFFLVTFAFVSLSFPFRLTPISSGSFRQVDGAHGDQIHCKAHVCVHSCSAALNRFLPLALRLCL